MCTNLLVATEEVLFNPLEPPGLVGLNHSCEPLTRLPLEYGYIGEHLLWSKVELLANMFCESFVPRKCGPNTKGAERSQLEVCGCLSTVLDTSNLISILMESTSPGRAPDIWFTARLSPCILVRKPTAEGMVPASWLESTKRCL